MTRLVKQFSEMQKMMKKMGMAGGGKKGKRRMGLPGGLGGGMPDMSELEQLMGQQQGGLPGGGFPSR